MPLLNFDEFKWRTMTAAINQIPPQAKFLQEMVFKKRIANPSQHIDVDVVVGGRNVLPFVSDAAAGTVVEKMGRKMLSIRAPRLRPKKPFNAPELLATRGVGANFYGSSGDPSKYRKEKIAMELADLKDNYVNTTIEWMCATALTGSMAVTQDDLAFSVDYQIPSGHKPDLSGDGALKWNGMAPDIMGNLETWSDLTINAIGMAPDIAIMGKNAWAAIRSDSDILELLDNRRFEGGGLAPEVSKNYKGTLNGIDLYRYGMTYTDTAGSAQNFIDDDAFILICTNARFSVEFGLIYDLDAEASVQAEYFAKTWIEKDPSVQWILAESHPLPVIWQPEAVVYATVTG